MPALVPPMLRLVDLLADERDITILTPVNHKEIVYRVLVGDQGSRLRQIAAAGSQSQQVAKAIEWLKVVGV
ncbi:MAG: AraC family transcriptional regulator N-terminal domain-containing protein [Geobacteraceae bacterium]